MLIWSCWPTILEGSWNSFDALGTQSMRDLPSELWYASLEILLTLADNGFVTTCLRVCKVSSLTEPRELFNVSTAFSVWHSLLNCDV